MRGCAMISSCDDRRRIGELVHTVTMDAVRRCAELLRTDGEFDRVIIAYAAMTPAGRAELIETMGMLIAAMRNA